MIKLRKCRIIFEQALRQCSEDEETKLAIAACFHDIGLWSDQTVDYIPPSIVQAKRYLTETGQDDWSEEIGLMIEWHHKVRRYRDDQFPLVEVFRKGDLVDLSLGFFKCGLPKSFVNEVKARIPNAGFHRFLMIPCWNCEPGHSPNGESSWLSPKRT